MAEVTTRGGGLPRSGLRGRGRGRGGSNFNGTPHSNNSTNGFTSKVNGHRPYQARPSTHSPPNDEPEEMKMIRKKHGQKLATIRELFPTWTDEDLLMALNEASGDLELAATRISEGLAEQWGSVKSKKDKKVVPSATQALSNPRAQNSGGVNNVGSGARGRTDVSRGTTRGGGGRGAAPRGSGRGQWATGSSRPSPTIGNDSSTATATPSAWNLGPPASLGTPALSSDAATVEPVPVASMEPELDDGTDLPPTTSIAEENKPASLLRDLNAQPAELPPNSHTAESKRPASRVIPPGSKMSWAQIARPTEPPKPQPAPVVRAPPSQPIMASEADMSGDTTAPSLLEPISPPENLEPSATALLADKQVTITIPDASADVWHTEPVPAIDTLKNDVATTGPNVWNDDPVPQPLGVGEGWAETVLARPNDQASIFNSQVTNSTLLTPSDAINIAPIEMKTPVSSNVADIPITSSVIAQDQSTQTVPETVSIHVTPASQPAMNIGMSAPPGLSKRANPRKGQEAAVVMPGSGTPNVDRIGLQFGSLSLFDEASGSEVNHAPPQDAPSPPVTSMDKIVVAETTLKPEELSIENPITPPQPPAEQLAPPSPSSVAPVVEEKLAPQPVPTIVHTSPLQSHANVQSQPPATQPPSSAFASRYPANNQYSAPEPTSTAHPSSSLSHPQAQPQPQQQQAPPQQDAFLHYSGFRQDPMAAYFQQQGQQQQPQQQSVVGQHSSSPAPASQSSAYGAFNHMSQQQQQQAQQHQQQAQQHQQQLQQQLPPQSQQPAQPGFGQTPQTAQEYASLYGQETLRSLGYYDSYSHAQAAQAAFQSRSPHGGEDTSKSSVSNPNQAAGPPGQPQAVAQHQQPAVAAVSAASQQYPGMQASPMPYPYYPYYQQYGQLPPSYQNPAYPYGMQAPSPYYSVQGSQQYPVSGPRSGQSQYSIQAGPGHTGGTAGNPLPSSHHQQPQHGSQHTLGGGVGLVGNSGFRQVSQPGVGGSQLPGSQVTGQGVVVGSGLVAPGSTTAGVQGGQQPSSMQQHHAYYGSNYGYGDSQQAQQGAIGAGHHHSQQPPQSNNRHSHHQGGGGQGGQIGLGGPSGQGGNGNDRKDPFNTFSSDRFFGQ